MITKFHEFHTPIKCLVSRQLFSPLVHLNQIHGRMSKYDNQHDPGETGNLDPGFYAVRDELVRLIKQHQIMPKQKPLVNGVLELMTETNQMEMSKENIFPVKNCHFL